MLALVLACALGVFQPQSAQPEEASSGQVEYRKALNELRAKVPGPNAWDALVEVRTLLLDVSDKAPGPDGESGGSVDWGALSDESADAAERVRTQKAIELARQRGLGAMITRISQSGGVVRPAAQGPLIDDEFPELWTVRACSKINRAAMTEAARQGQWDAWLERARESLGISRLYMHDNMMIGYLVGAAAHNAALRDIKLDVNGGGIPESHLARLATLLDSTTPIERPSVCIEGARLLSKSSIEQVHNVAELPGLASKKEALAKADEFYDNAARLALLSFHDRKVDAFQVSAFEDALDSKRHRAFAVTLPAVSKLFVTVTQADAEAAATKLMVALERFRLKYGKYPGAAQELVPEFLASVPLDPFTGKALLYRGPQGQAYDGGRVYLVYSTGYDEEDNGGSPHPEEPMRAYHRGGIGRDLILNPSPVAETQGKTGK